MDHEKRKMSSPLLPKNTLWRSNTAFRLKSLMTTRLVGARVIIFVLLWQFSVSVTNYLFNPSLYIQIASDFAGIVLSILHLGNLLVLSFGWNFGRY